MGLVPCPTPYTQQVRNSGKVRANIKGKRMSDLEIRLKCLELATAQDAPNPIATARAMLDFIYEELAGDD